MTRASANGRHLFVLCIMAVVGACAPKASPVAADEQGSRRSLAATYVDTYILPDRVDYLRAAAIAEVGRRIEEGSEAASNWKGRSVPAAYEQAMQLVAPDLKEQIVEILASNFESAELRNLIDSEAILRRADVQAAGDRAVEAPVEQRPQILRGAMSDSEYTLVFERTPPARVKEMRLLNQMDKKLVSSIKAQMDLSLRDQCKNAPSDVTLCSGISRNP